MQSGTLPNLTGHIVDDGRLHLLRPIGAGAFGRVYKALDTTSPASSPTYYAVKCLRRPGLRSHDAKFQDRERALHRRVSAHPNILTLHRQFTDPKHAFLVLDLCAGGDMFGAIMDGVYHKNTALIKHTFASIIDAVRWCHARGVYHRDLKPENVLVNYEGGDALIADFGLCTDSQVSHDVDCGSGSYMAPESFGSASTSYCPQDSDTWALCIILINLIAAMNPWHSAQSTDHRWNAFMADPDYLREILPISTSLNELLKRCFRIDPARRPTLTELRTEVLAMKHFYMSDADLLKASPGVRRAAGCSPLPLNPQDPSDCSASGLGASQVLDSISGSGYSSPSGDMRRPLSIAPPAGLAPPHAAAAAATGSSSLLSVPAPAPSAPKAPFPSTGDVSATETENSLTPVEHLVQLPDAASASPSDEPPTGEPLVKSSPTPGKFKRFMRRLRIVGHTKSTSSSPLPILSQIRFENHKPKKQRITKKRKRPRSSIDKYKFQKATDTDKIEAVIDIGIYLRMRFCLLMTGCSLVVLVVYLNLTRHASLLVCSETERLGMRILSFSGAHIRGKASGSRP